MIFGAANTGQLSRKPHRTSPQVFLCSSPAADGTLQLALFNILVTMLARVFYLYHFKALPITDDRGLLTGIVARCDIAKSVATIPWLPLWA
jgi:hypothetical protein